MSCSSCTNGCSSCGCREPIGNIPPQVRVIREALPVESGCAIDGWYETLAATSFVPQDFGETQTVDVCDAYAYLPGTCILLIDTAGNKQVQRVIGRASDTQITVEAYSNANSDESTNLSGVIYAAPLAVCPDETAAAETCDLKHLVTDGAFIMPAADGDVEITLTQSVTLQVGQTVYIEGAGYMEVTEPPVGDFEPCGTSFYFTNLGTGGNATPGDNIGSGAYGVLTPPPAAISATKGAFRRVVSVGGSTVNADTAIAFDTQDFSGMTGIGTFGGGGSTFTADIAGVFHFNACVRFETGSFNTAPDEAHLVLCVDGVVKAHGNAAVGGSSDDLLTVGGTVHLDIGDVVSIRWLDTSSGTPASSVDLEDVSATEISAWSGFLVYAD